MDFIAKIHKDVSWNQWIISIKAIAFACKATFISWYVPRLSWPSSISCLRNSVYKTKIGSVYIFYVSSQLFEELKLEVVFAIYVYINKQINWILFCHCLLILSFSKFLIDGMEFVFCFDICVTMWYNSIVNNIMDHSLIDFNSHSFFFFKVTTILWV